MTAAAAPALAPTMPQRRVPRYKLAVPLNLTVLRSGIPDRLPGRTLEIGEGGIGVVVASQLLLGESVRVEFLLPHMTTPVRATAVVRYQREQCFGLQFLRLPDEQQSIIRYWTRREADILLGEQRPSSAPPVATAGKEESQTLSLADFEDSDNGERRSRIRRMVVTAALIILATVTLAWWQWQQGWTELEAKLPAKQTEAAKPQVTVPADAMMQRIRHQVMPEYPEAARQARVQGTVVLDAVVSAQGVVTDVKAVSGPEALSLAALDAVRWWRYEPYLVNGQPATVETTVVVDFRLPN